MGGSVTPQVQIHGTTGASAREGFGRWTADAGGFNLFSVKSRGAAVGTHTVVQNSDALVNLVGLGSDGTNFQTAAQIQLKMAASGAISSSSMPGTIVISTTAAGATTVSTALTIDSQQISTFSGGVARGITTQTGSTYTVQNTDTHIIANASGTLTLTLPSASTWTGRELTVRTIAAFTVVSASSNVVPVAGGSAGTAILAATAGKWAVLVSDGSNWQIQSSN